MAQVRLARVIPSCMCTCVLRLGCFLFISPVFYFVPPFSFQPFLMFTSEFNERSRSNPLCDFRLGTVATSDHETPLTSLPALPLQCQHNPLKKENKTNYDWMHSLSRTTWQRKDPLMGLDMARPKSGLECVEEML